MADIVRLTPRPPSDAEQRARVARAQAMLEANNGGYSSAAVDAASSYCDDRLTDDQIVALYNEFIAPRINSILRTRGREPIMRRIPIPR
jgi:hypothetical protein